ncbi:GINS complex subunit 3 (Psf3) [Perkinsus chesapeaki]|uniref:GINS complex subunit 3 (Psf3) n=1 Tax=Perkinsus chesapeaki TaxID=330153 RepID=A0A7J6N2F5_PERCH|nr:GINS complex subunit 3 (Psf3) [Perkinsus chesapeaki]
MSSSSSSSFTQDVFSEDPVFSSGSVRTDTTASGGFQYTGGGGGAKYARKDYWDLDQILQDEQLIDCRLIDTAYGLGWMNTRAAEGVAGNASSSGAEGDANHLPADCKLSFPLWIAEGLYLRRFVEIEEVPAIFNNKMQGLMTLEASVMRLDQKSFYYFEVGMRLAALLGLHTLMERLLRGMFDRTRNIFDVAQTQIVGADQEKRMQVLMDFMTRSEREIFHQGVITAGEYDLFRNGELSRVRQSAVHIAPRKE